MLNMIELPWFSLLTLLNSGLFIGNLQPGV
jgi:hypothetical protein